MAKFTTNELTVFLSELDDKLAPLRKCLSDIQSGMEEDVSDHYDCAMDLVDISDWVSEQVSAFAPTMLQRDFERWFGSDHMNVTDLTALVMELGNSEYPVYKLRRDVSEYPTEAE